jgi:hypothetical protein
VGRTEACARAVADAGIERRPDNGDVSVGNVLEAGKPGEGAEPGIARDDSAVCGPDDARILSHGFPLRIAPLAVPVGGRNRGIMTDGQWA